jgi:hypothetical protein
LELAWNGPRLRVGAINGAADHSLNVWDHDHIRRLRNSLDDGLGLNEENVVAKSPGTPKSKAAAPVQFDMNSRERKGGKGRPGGPGGAGRRDDKRPPSRIVRLPPALIDRGEGWVIQKIGRIDEASHIAMGAEYHLIFDGHDPLTFDYLANARDRAKEAPPEKPQVEKVAIAPETGERQ